LSGQEKGYEKPVSNQNSNKSNMPVGDISKIGVLNTETAINTCKSSHT